MTQGMAYDSVIVRSCSWLADILHCLSTLTSWWNKPTAAALQLNELLIKRRQIERVSMLASTSAWGMVAVRFRTSGSSCFCCAVPHNTRLVSAAMQRCRCLDAG